ncbi:hypothetical protein OG788_43980 [Streptomyces sp. NBC_00647]|uniref:hypothetical protein n=1 Tax=Streptomyces sp. NBC_00647 TaxID=2975796 RepID=UPI00324457C2
MKSRTAIIVASAALIVAVGAMGGLSDNVISAAAESPDAKAGASSANAPQDATSRTSDILDNALGTAGIPGLVFTYVLDVA